LVQDGFSNPGYFTIDLNELIPIKVGDVFEVAFNITTDGRAAFPISEIISLNTLFYNENVSYVSYDGVTWQDLFELEWEYPGHSYYSQVACIKAFTVLDEIETQTFINLTARNSDVNIGVRVLNQYGNPVRGGKVVFNLSGELFESEVSNGFADLVHDFDFGTYDISAEYVASGYLSSRNSTSITISKVNAKINVDITTFKDTALVNITLSRPSNDEIVVNNKTFKLNNGVYAYNLTGLVHGVYDISVHLLSDIYVSDDVSANFTITYLKTNVVAGDFETSYASGDKIIVKLVDELNNPVVGRNVSYVIVNVTDVDSTGLEGQIYIPTSFNVGVYDVNICFDGDDDYAGSNASVRLTINKASVLISDVISVNRTGAQIEIDISEAINGSVVLTVDGKDYVLNLTDGFVSFNLSGLDFGEHDVTVKLISSSYEAQDLHDAFNITCARTAFIADDFETAYDSGDNIVVKLVDQFNNPVVGRNVYCSIGEDFHDISTDLEGQIYIPTSFNVGVYDVRFSFDGDDDYVGSNASVRLTVNKASVLISDVISVNRTDAN
jgi:uncharacterized protein with GYD domain